ncbi:hypothetical protein C0Q44_26235 [Paenibacillus sp. PCH8]|nr:hypothetical protein C0Q44_26235 [Paenibacillus sp. PCH8]
MRANTSPNTIFTHRAFALGPARSKKWNQRGISAAGKLEQPDTSAPTKRIAPGDIRRLKSVGRREYNNVIRQNQKQ